MNAFIIEFQDRPGEFARIAEAIAQKGINITGFAGVTCGGSGGVAIITNDEDATRAALRGVNATVKEREVVTAAVGADTPGTLAAMARKLADAGLNIEAAFAVGMSGGDAHVAVVTSDA
ncbi:MAG: hypothetical protein ACJ761_08425, partial [Chloroflexota bacterium]